MRAAVWRKHAKKARKKLRRSLRRDGLPNPFEFPDLSAAELAAWINEDRPPDWADDAAEQPEPEGEDQFEPEGQEIQGVGPIRRPRRMDPATRTTFLTC